MRRLRWGGVGFALAMVCGVESASAEYKIGFVTSLTGPAASLGIPYGRGIATGHLLHPDIAGEPITVIQFDDGSDPSAATREARKLIEEEKVDLLIGSGTNSASLAMASVANELKTPLIAISPIKAARADDGKFWTATVPQPPPLMVKAVTDRIVRDGVKKLGFIAYSEAFGDLVYDGVKKAETPDGLQIVAAERYARADTSVTAQALKIVAAQPEAVINGASGAQGALPFLALAERGYKGKLYGLPGMLNTEFVRVAGKAGEGVLCSGGPVIVAEQLPDDHYAKKISLEFREAHQKANGAPSTDSFAPYSFDAWLLFVDAATRAKDKAKPGTPAFHEALRAALFSVKNLAGTQGLYNFSEESSYGVGPNALVLMRLVDGKWKYEP